MSVTVGRSSADFRRWRVRTVAKNIEETGQKLHQKIHVQMDSELVFATPVGNPALWSSPAPPGYTGGRARGGWQSSIGAPILTETNRIDKNGAATHSAGQEVASRIGFAKRSFIANNVPYIVRLNEGWSTQAPANFIGRAFDRVGAQFG